MTFTRVHTFVSFADPHLVCGECGKPVNRFHDPDRCGCQGTFYLCGCGHAAEAKSTCPSWGPVDGCTCEPPCPAEQMDRATGSEGV